MNSKLLQKKKLFILLILFLIVDFANATVSNYTFNSSSGAYSAISGTTLVTGLWDDGSSPLLTLPFTFTYNNIPYTTVSVNYNGFLTMGAVPADVYCGLQTSAPNSIAGYGTDLIGASSSSTIKYVTTGSTPNRKFVVQWTDCDHYNNGNQNHWVFQIVLNESSNTIQVVWGASTDATTLGVNNCADIATESGDVGLIGNSTADFNLRSVTNGTNTWTTSVVGNAINAICNMSSVNLPPSGLTYSWTPAPSVTMSFVSCSTVFINNSQSVSPNTVNDQIIQVQVVTTGTLTPFNLTNLSLTTAGCTNPTADISNAKVYFTGLSPSFTTSSQFGSTVTGPNGSYSISGNVVLSEGVNFFWITYDIKSSAVLGHNLSGCCSQITGSSALGLRIPSVTCPVGSQTIAQIGTWTPLVNAAPGASGGVMILLSDGTVMAKSTSGGGDGNGNLWNKLSPDINGSYINGTWTTLAAMHDTRLYFSSQVLKDGRVYVAGGEYGTGLATGETYNPLTNIWTSTPPPGQNVSDANSEILSDGWVLQALVAGTLRGTAIYNPTSNTYVTGPTALGIHNESAWVKLPDNSILYINRLSTASERYIPATNTWIADASVPVQLYDAFGDECGAALLLPDGRALFFGSSGHNAYYTPSGTTSPGIWTTAPDFPNGKGTPDAPAALMVNGKILCTASPIPTAANHFPAPTTYYEFNYLTNTFSQINAPAGGTTLNESCYVTNMLDLPDGKVLYSDQGSSTYYVYTPRGAALLSGKPVIDNIIANGCNSYTITGIQFNGISQGAAYGDDWQMASNYPLVRLTSGANVYYARTFNWNTTGVQRGNAPDTTQFTIPAGLPPGTYSLVVVANGISSDPISFTYATTVTLSSTLSPNAICSGSLFTYTPTSNYSTATFSWTRAAVAGINNAAVTTPQSSNPSEVLINTTQSPKSVTYLFTINANGCSSNTQQVTVIVNPVPVPSTITAGGATTFCSGNSVLLTGNSTGGTWSLLGGTANTLTVTTSGDYFVTNTNSCGSTTSNHIIVTVNPLPFASILTAGGPTALCNGQDVLISGNSSGGTWSIVGGNNPTLLVNTSGDYFTTTTNSCGTTTSNHIIVSVNALVNYYLDADLDGYYTGSVLSTCINPGAGYVTSVIGPNDCNDNVAWINPAAIEVCNGFDDDCNGLTDEGCGVTLNLKVFIEGFYLNNGLMKAVLFNRNLSIDPTACDSIVVELYNSNSPYSMITSFYGILHTDGTISIALPNSVISNLYYVAIHHRNTMVTWSKEPLLFNSTNMSFDFTAPE